MLYIPFCNFLVSKKVGFFYPKTITSRNFIAIHDVFLNLYQGIVSIVLIRLG